MDDGLETGQSELDITTQYLVQILGYHVNFTRYCTLTVCSQPIRVCLMYNN